MNAPLTESTHKVIDKVSLEDKYTQERGRAFMSGVQALVRLPMVQQPRDAQAGLQTAGFISGYRGSPLGGYDQALWKASDHLKKHNIVFQPGVNEELAATAVWGTQQVELFPEQKNTMVFLEFGTVKDRESIAVPMCSNMQIWLALHLTAV